MLDLPQIAQGINYIISLTDKLLKLLNLSVKLKYFKTSRGHRENIELAASEGIKLQTFN